MIMADLLDEIGGSDNRSEKAFGPLLSIKRAMS